MLRISPAAGWAFFVLIAAKGIAAAQLEPIQYNHPGLVVDLGVGLWAWPLPMDYDRDGDLDLVVSCPDKPYNGTYFFENPGMGRASRTQPPEQPAPGTVDQPATSYQQPIFKPGVRIADGPTNVQVSYIDGEPVVMTPGQIYADFRAHQYSRPIKLPLPEKIDPQYKRYRANQWKLLDWEGDGDLDVIVGIGIWDDYGWDDAWDAEGNWKNGPLHGYVYLVENQSPATASLPSDQSPATASPGPDAPLLARLQALVSAKFAEPRKLTTAAGEPIDVFGMPSPNFADFNGDSALDLLCGEFLDGFTFFKNVGTREAPQFAPGVKLTQGDGQTPLKMDLQMITPVALDWDGDGQLDLICGDEDGRVALMKQVPRMPIERALRRRAGDVSPPVTPHTPDFRPPVYFQQQAADVKFGALVTPFSVDWDHDGDEDLICGNTAGYIGFIENLGGNPPQWAAPRCLHRYEHLFGDVLTEQLLRHEAGPKGSIQGPCEAKWGYTTQTAADWDGDSITDLVVNDIWGRVVWYRRGAPSAEEALEGPNPLVVAWAGALPKPQWLWWTPEPGTLATQWRTTPCAVDWNGDGLTELVMLDHEGYLALYERTRQAPEVGPGADTPGSPDLVLMPPKRMFKITGPCEFDSRHKPVGEKQDDLLRLNAGRAGASGRRKLHVVDWDGDGRLDLLVNSTSVNWLRNVRTDDAGFTWFEDRGPLDDRVLAGHDTAPATVDWNADGIPDLLVGAEDGRLYYKPNPRSEPTEIERRRMHP